jgi:hypothetical protein
MKNNRKEVIQMRLIFAKKLTSLILATSLAVAPTLTFVTPPQEEQEQALGVVNMDGINYSVMVLPKRSG